MVSTEIQEIHEGYLVRINRCFVREGDTNLGLVYKVEPNVYRKDGMFQSKVWVLWMTGKATQEPDAFLEIEAS